MTDIIDGKRVFGPPKEIEEVKNAKSAYLLLEKVDPYSVDDLLKVHGLMVGGLTAQAGRFRTVGVGVYRGRSLFMPDCLTDWYQGKSRRCYRG